MKINNLDNFVPKEDLNPKDSVIITKYTAKEVKELLGISNDFFNEIVLEYGIMQRVNGRLEPTPQYRDKFMWKIIRPYQNTRIPIWYFTYELKKEIESFL